MADYRSDDMDERLANASRRQAEKYQALREKHVSEYHKWYDRVELASGGNAARNRQDHAFNQGNDPDLMALYLQFGRYLLISSTRRDRSPKPSRDLGERGAIAVERGLSPEHKRSNESLAGRDNQLVRASHAPDRMDEKPG